MLETVTVTEVYGNKAKVKMERKTACGECGKCMIGKKNLVVTAEVINDIGAQPGDEVLAEMTLAGVFSASLIMYGIPLAAFFAGIWLGNSVLSGVFGMSKDLCALICGFSLMAISYIPIKICDKKGIFKERYQITLKGKI